MYRKLEDSLDMHPLKNYTFLGNNFCVNVNGCCELANSEYGLNYVSVALLEWYEEEPIWS